VKATAQVSPFATLKSSLNAVLSYRVTIRVPAVFDG
jgi:hypothetical protein